MNRYLPFAAVASLLCARMSEAGEAEKPRTPGPGAEQSILIDDFQGEHLAWGFNRGDEFPGAQGSAELDKDQKHAGSASLRITGDFSKGGNYVGVDKTLSSPDIGALSFWVRSDGPSRLTLRLVNGTGQCHQINRVPLANTSAWQKVALDIAPRIGEEHWGGANDGQWHPPAKLIAINLDKGALPPGRSSGTLWLDEVHATIRKAPAAVAIKGIEQTVLLDDFEGDRLTWGFTRGEEFAGAQALVPAGRYRQDGKALPPILCRFQRRRRLCRRATGPGISPLARPSGDSLLAEGRERHGIHHRHRQLHGTVPPKKGLPDLRHGGLAGVPGRGRRHRRRRALGRRQRRPLARPGQTTRHFVREGLAAEIRQIRRRRSGWTTSSCSPCCRAFRSGKWPWATSSRRPSLRDSKWPRRRKA